MSTSTTHQLKLIVEKNKKGKPLFFVNIERKKGLVKTILQESMIKFPHSLATDGSDVIVEEVGGVITKATLPGIPDKDTVTPKKPNRYQPPSSKGGQRSSYNRDAGNRSLKTNERDTISTNSCDQGNPSLIGMPFYNPYTFIPFVERGTKLERKTFTPRTNDERETKRFTGIIELKIETLSPLLSSDSNLVGPSDHKTYHALRIGNDVIVPATGVRGFLRYLIMLLTGGPLTTIDQGMNLCQGRNLQLGSGKKDAQGVKNVFLARIVKPGNSKRSGTIELGETRLVDLENLRRFPAFQEKQHRPNKSGSVSHILWADLEHTGNDTKRPCLRKINSLISLRENEQPSHKNKQHTWRLKLSGWPVTGKKKKDKTPADKFEGAFQRNGITIEIPKEIWGDYMFRHRHGDRKELQKNDLVWLCPVKEDEVKIERADQIKSLQWARWGREGIPLKDAIPKDVYPDYFGVDDKVSLVTDMFGQVPVKDEKTQTTGKAFAGRVRPDNLVFEDAVPVLDGPFDLAVMSSPHPGCMAFYRNNDDPQTVSSNDMLRGYKVYRTSKEAESKNSKAPWLFDVQGVFDDTGTIKKEGKQTINISAQLLPKGLTGTLRLSVRSLNDEELAILLLACNGTWRLGGGKPLGLGHCKATVVALYDEFGKPFNVTDFPKTELFKLAKQRIEFWEKTQIPQENVRYPRAVIRDKNKNSRGGHAWFSKCAIPKKNPKNENEQIGMTPITVCGRLMESVRESGIDNSHLGQEAEIIFGQTLPKFDPNKLDADLLYGYDALFCDEKSDTLPFPQLSRKNVSFNRARVDAYPEIVLFNEAEHVRGSEKGQENLSQNAQTRNEGRSLRGT